MKEFILEVCADSVESTLAAVRAGASRIELCNNIIIGGTTPSPKLFEEIRKHNNIKMHVLIRPRFGDFCYTKYEIDIMKEEIKMYRELGAEGVVIGILNPDGTLNSRGMYDLMEEADGMSVTMHRAFDMSVKPYQTMEEAITLGIDTILTSGQKNVCMEGIPLLKGLQERSNDRICIQAGAGVNGASIRTLYEATGIRSYHMSGKIVVDSAMSYRQKEVNMGLEGLSEYTIYRTSEEEIQLAKEALERCEAAAVNGNNEVIGCGY